MKRRILSVPAAVALSLIVAGVVFASTYDERLAHGRALTDAVNAHRSADDLARKYFLYKLGDQRSQERADERDATGTSEFPHDIGRAQRLLEELDICYNWVGEVVGYSNTLPTTSDAVIADAIVDRWWASDDHRPELAASSADWGGGGWVRSASGTYFFAFYVVDACGV